MVRYKSRDGLTLQLIIQTITEAQEINKSSDQSL